MAKAEVRAVDEETDRGHAKALLRLPGRAYWLIGLVALAMLGAWLVIEVQASVTAYVNAEGLWSKMQKQSVLALYRYAGSGDPRDLAEARAALRTPLEDLAFRREMDRDPPDIAAGYRHVRNAGNRSEDLDRLVWVYRLLADAPYLRDSVHAWRRTDTDLQTLVDTADELEARWRRGTPDSVDVAEYRGRLYAINARIYPLTVAFSDSLARGAAAVRHLLLLLSAVSFVLLTWYALRVMQHALRHVRETEAEFRMAFHQAAVGMLKIAPDGRLVQANEALAKLLNVPLPELRRMRVQDVVPAEDLATAADGTLEWRQLLQSGERRLLNRDGSVRWVRWTASLLAQPAPEQIFVLLEDVSKARELAHEIAHQASHDELTGLINRREIGRRLGEGLNQARRGNAPHVLAFIDVDQFKLVNDTCGHAVGDRFLRRFANLLSQHLHGGDWLGRLGGDEFAIFLHDMDIAEGARVVGEIHDRLSRTAFRWDDREMPFHCSIGLAEINADAANVEWLLSAADAACYLAKEEGRNRVRVYSDANLALARRRFELEWVANAQAAISERRLLAYAQKILPLQPVPGQGLHYEVLVRMRGKDGVLHPPGELLAAMERFGQAIAVDSYVVDAVLAEFDRSPAHVQRLALCHINVSAQSIADPTFLDFVTERLDQRPAIADKLCFELTETAMVGNLTDARRFIDAVRERGCCVALDDFGSGLSSYGYLKGLPVDIVKIDSVFVRDIGTDGNDLAMVRSMAQVARALGKIIVAEGIESAQIVPRLAQVGIDYVQGYAVHEPCPLEELVGETDASAGAWPIMNA